MDAPVWRPTSERVRDANLTRFMHRATDRWSTPLDDVSALHRWSVDHPEWFWRSLVDDAGVIGDGFDGSVLLHADRMPGARFFPDARLNAAENLLRRRDDADAIVFWGEDRVRRRLSFDQLHSIVARLAAWMDLSGIGPGDRVAGYLPNLPETVAAMLAAASLGATWSSCSPDFGVDGVLDRFGQIEPKLLVAADGYLYAGRSIDRRASVAEVSAGLPTVERTLVVAYSGDGPDIEGIPKAVAWTDAVAFGRSNEVAFRRLPFDHPLYILYSSGTTGRPKCIVHGAGGTLLQHLKEHRLHCDVRRDDRVFYFTTCGWMMWNWLVSALASEATLLLYDGSPFAADGRILYDFADTERMTLFGTAARYIDACAKAGLAPKDSHALTTLRTMTSTGSPLAPASFDYVYNAIKPDLHLASISGGTDLLSCFVLGNPIGPVWRGEIQMPGLGMAVDVVDDLGQPIAAGERGELVCRKPWPSMPVGFWNDPDGSRYRAAYFERFPGVWHHGDYVRWTTHDGMVIEGRSDATLNPGGVRIGTAELYRQVERLSEISEAVAIGHEWRGDVRIVLFVVLRPGSVLDAALVRRIRDTIRQRCSPRHVPAKIIAVADIPRTRSGKISEIAVRDTVHGRDVANVGALANPEALEHFRGLSDLAR